MHKDAHYVNRLVYFFVLWFGAAMQPFLTLAFGLIGHREDAHKPEVIRFREGWWLRAGPEVAVSFGLVQFYNGLL